MILKSKPRLQNEPDKGIEGGSCNRTACQKPNAIYYNKATHRFYCKQCMILIHRASPSLNLFKEMGDK